MNIDGMMSAVLDRALLASFDSIDPPIMLPNVPYQLSHDDGKIKIEAIALEDYWMKPAYQVRGPDPDKLWFVVLVDGDDETAIDEVFSSEEDAAAKCEALNDESAGQAET